MQRMIEEPYCILRVGISREEFEALDAIHTELVQFVERIDAPALHTLGGLVGVAHALLTTAIEHWQAERDEAASEEAASDQDAIDLWHAERDASDQDGANT